jgi:cysteinyl-tRNA synthetase, unknown class
MRVAAAATPPLAAPPAGAVRIGRMLARSLVFALALIASAAAGAGVTLLLWGARPGPSRVDAVFAELPAPGQQATIGRSDDPQYPEPLVHSSEAESTLSERPEPKNFSRTIKTVKFAPVTQPIVTAAIGPLPGNIHPEVAAPMGKLPEVRSWRYQLQGVDPAAIAASSSDLVVIDYAGSNGAFTRAEVEQMKRKPDGSRRIVLSYMSIGEAESYRPYWDDNWQKKPPAWLGAENSKWRGNYGVRFWHPEWQQIIFDYTDTIIAAGFDGVYLDKVDEFETMGRPEDMVEFVTRISARAKRERADFMVVSQNGDALIPNARFRKAIDAFAREDLLYGETGDGARNSASSIRESIKRLKLLTAEGKPVLVVEYPSNDKQAQSARREISEQKFIGLMARRALDQL